MSELEALQRENKKLKLLLKNAVVLLNKSKDALAQAATPAAKKPIAKKKTAAKRR